MKILSANFAKMVDDSGGLAKVTCAFANVMKNFGHEVLLMYADEREGKFFFPIDDEIQLCNLCRFNSEKISYPLIYKVKREILRPFSKIKARTLNDDFIEKFLLPNVKAATEKFKPDVVICSQPASGKIFLSDLKINVPVIVMSHGDPEDYFHTYPPKEIAALEKSSVCQVLMPSFVAPLKKRFPDLPVKVIGNVIPQYKDRANLSAEKNFYKIIFVGRLVRNHKRPHLLIEAFTKIAKDFPDWIVELWGADSKKSYTESLRKKISKAGLNDRIFLKGTTNEVEKVLRDGDIFVFPSAYEGFGMTAGEAMSAGLPVVAYKNCSAINELVQDGATGFLCDDGVEPLAEKMSLLMKNRELRIKMGAAARESMKKYSPEKIWGEWQKLLNEVLKNEV